MDKAEFEKRIKEFKLQKIYQEDEMENIFGNKKELYIDKETSDLYGCFFEEEKQKYVIFFIDAERGIAKDIGSYKTEEEAYEKLFNKIKKWSLK